MTGSLGEGHHAAARAVEQRVQETWPDADVVWTDTLDGMGRGTGPVFRRIYAGCVRYLPWLYALYHWLLCRVPPFRAGTRAVIGVWSARGLAATLARHRPDLVVATFPEGITGLARLRRTGRLAVRTVALVADPAPHPLWIGDGLDLHLVSTSVGEEVLRRWAPDAAVRVIAPPVVRRFAPPPDQRLPLRPRVLVSCGSMAFGDVPALCAAALDNRAEILVGTGRDPGVRRRLERLAGTHPYGGGLNIVDWIDDPAAATRAADVVVTNAGGATALEAIACARPLLLVDPVPGHGRANAAVLTAAGLARTCHGPKGLSSALQELARPGRYDAAVATLRAHLDDLDPDADVRAVAGPSGGPGAAGGNGTGSPRPAPQQATGPVRPADAFFLAAETEQVPQQVGAVIVLDPGPGDDRDPDGWPEHLRALVRDRAGRSELLTRVAEPGVRDRWRRVAAPEPHRHVLSFVFVADGRRSGFEGVAEAFFGTALDPGLGWELGVAHEPATGRVAILARAHHALGDGLGLTDALVGLLTDEGARTAPAAASSAPQPTVRGQPRPTVRGQLRRAGLLVRGVAHLAAMPPAGRSPLTGRVRGPVHRRIGLCLDGREVRAAARAHGVGTTALVLAVLADALHTTFAEAGTPAPRVRAMVPITRRTRADEPSRGGGNRMAVVPVDLPTGPLPPAERVARVAEALRRAGGDGRPEAAAAAVAAAGRLPPALRGPVVRLLHGRRFFHLVASVMPGVRRAVHVRGRRIREIIPVLPLAGGVGLAVGVLHCGESTGVGITADQRVVPLAGGIPTRLRASLRTMHQGCTNDGTAPGGR